MGDNHDEDMDTEYDSEDEDMTYSEDDVYDYDSDAEDVGDTMMMDHHPHHLHPHLASHHETAPRIVLAPVAV
jgi:hypothetical protein